MIARWPVADLRAALDALLPGCAVEVLPEIDSSNTELMRRARAGVAAPVLLVAERQTAGRGRLGRPWQSTAQAGPSALDESLTFSLGLPLAPGDWSGLSLAAGVSVAESLDPEGRHLRLKWPNDLWTVQDRKLGGILIETALPQAGAAQRYLVIGVGLNIGPREATGLSTAPAWLRELRPEAQAPQVLLDVVPPLVRSVLGFAEHGFGAFAQSFAARDALHGRDVLLSDGTGGACEGVGPSGELRVRTAAGLQSVTSAEVSVRPIGGAR
ncbi:MAG: biotin--[acetyl-CoA-carboxylase] ligase [Comamonadaceae bacterium]|nr:MAG: biotin--[acetyl-CoA-carboxylase] ligase [Comamonadaceae bacterium]